MTNMSDFTIARKTGRSFVTLILSSSTIDKKLENFEFIFEFRIDINFEFIFEFFVNGR